MKNLIFILPIIFFIFSESVFGQTLTADYFQVNPGNQHGIKFWGNTDNYKIHLDNTFDYGTITDYSIRTNITGNAGRGWTWGIVNQAPVTGIDNNGNIQTNGYVKSMSSNIYWGDNQRIYGNNNAALHYYSNHSTASHFSFYDKEGTNYGHIYGSGDGTNFGLLDGDGQWSYRAALDDYISFSINSSEKMRIEDNGYVGIGTATPQYKLDVCGQIRSEEVVVENNWCDYVFDEDYSLKSIDEQVEFIEENGHLANFESEVEMAGEINIGDVTKRQQQTIEEQMLYIGQLNEDNKELQKQNEELQEQFDQLIEMVKELQEQVEK